MVLEVVRHAVHHGGDTRVVLLVYATQVIMILVHRHVLLVIIAVKHVHLHRLVVEVVSQVLKDIIRLINVHV